MVSVVVIMVVTFVWAASILIGFIEHEWEGALYTTPLMGACVGYVTGIKIWRNGRE